MASLWLGGRTAPIVQSAPLHQSTSPPTRGIAQALQQAAVPQDLRRNSSEFAHESI